ncbi:MAG: hypothetical protein IKD88_00620 [Lachnospiraceae bacterium]|nr:hypothetical protein [Lachnospiraceae bacterium]
MKNMIKKAALPCILAAVMIAALAGCGTGNTSAGTDNGSGGTSAGTSGAITETAGSSGSDVNAAPAAAGAASALTAEDITVNETVENNADSEHAITADGENTSYSNTQVIKTGDSDAGDEADFYGDNAAVFASNGATLDLSEMVISTDGTHANAVFSYGEGTTVNISDSYIETSGNCSGGLMTTGGGTMNAENVTVTTSGNSSAAIRSDRGGGDVNVTGGHYTTSGVGSPVIYSTADITVNGAYLESTASQGVVVEGANSVTLNDVTLVANNTTKNGDHSDWHQAIMIYQSMSGDASEGLSSFAMTDGSLTNVTGDVFFITNTTTTIDLTNVGISNQDPEGIFLRAAAAGWGNEGSNGGQVTLTASDQTIDGDMIVDEVSALNLYLTEGSNYTGAINADGTAGEVYVEIGSGSTWTLTGDSYITALTCDADAIDLNGHTLYVNGEAYTEGTASEGEAVEMTVSDGGGSDTGMGMPGDGMPGERPDGAPPELPDGATPGEPPSGDPPAGAPGSSQN